jgi:glucokinase
MKKYAVGIDIGGTRTKVGLADLEKGLVLEMVLTPTEKDDADLFISNLYQQYKTLTEKAGITQDQIAGIGIGVPGFVHQDGSVDSTFGFLPFMDRHYHLKEELELKFSLPCHVDNDARVVALGEALFGKGKGFTRVLVLTLGTGLGIGLIVNGKFETKLPYAHLGGHITIATSKIKCYCGKYGCMEALVSGTGLIDSAVRAGLGQKESDFPLSVEAIFEAEQNGYKPAVDIVADFLDYLKTGISNFVSLYAPDIIIIGGGVSKGMTPYMEKLSQLNYLNPFPNYTVDLALSELDEQSGILGSAALFI